MKAFLQLAPLAIAASLLSVPVFAATTFNCQPGGGEVDPGDCLLASQALVLSQKRCSGKAEITASALTAKHGSCCATMYLEPWRANGQTAVYHSVDYLAMEFGRGISKCRRGLVSLDSGAVLIHNAEQCRGTYVGKRGGGASIPALVEATPVEADAGAVDLAEHEPGENPLKPRDGIDLCTRLPPGTVVPVDKLIGTSFILVRTTTGSGSARTLATAFIQGAWASLFIIFKDNLNNHNRLIWKYVSGSWLYSIAIFTGRATWGTVMSLVGERAIDEIIHKVVEDAASRGVVTITYAIKNELTGAVIASFSVSNIS